MTTEVEFKQYATIEKAQVGKQHRQDQVAKFLHLKSNYSFHQNPLFRKGNILKYQHCELKMQVHVTRYVDRAALSRSILQCYSLCNHLGEFSKFTGFFLNVFHNFIIFTDLRLEKSHYLQPLFWSYRKLTSIFNVIPLRMDSEDCQII